MEEKSLEKEEGTCDPVGLVSHIKSLDLKQGTNTI